MKLILGCSLGLLLGLSGQIAAEQMQCYGSGCAPVTVPWTQQTPQQFQQQQQHNTTELQMQQWFLNQNQQRPC